jgi:hypothetical protein
LDLVEEARAASPNDRIELRDPIAEHGKAAVEAMGEWLADPLLTRFAVRVIGRVAEFGDRKAAIDTLRRARDEASPDQRDDIDQELLRLGVRSTSSRRSRRGQPSPMADTGTAPGWLMRTDRSQASWLWAEVTSGRLRQGWGYQVKQDLNVLRDRRTRGEQFDRDDDWAWPNRRMLTDEPDGMRIDDLVLLPHLPREWHWAVVRITGPYRFEIDRKRGDYGHILPVEILLDDLTDVDLTDEIRRMRTYPARLRRLSQQASDDIRSLLVGAG